jgi:ribosome biogenesis GTPase A
MATGTAPVRESSTRAQDTIQHGVEQLFKIVDQQDLDSDDQLVASLAKLRKRGASNEVTLTVLGEFSAGKTTFINSLVGTDLLHTGILPTTAKCTYISYGPTAECDVILRNGSTVSISPKDAGQFSAEGSRATEVESVSLRLPSTLLQQGLIVVDTPGVNVNIEAHEALTAQAISQSNACVYLMDARQPGKKTTVDFLRQVSRNVGKFFFVLNRSDILDAQEQEEALEYLQQVLRDECDIRNPRIAIISSTLAAHEAPWIERFEELKWSLRSFMEQERQIVI